MTIISTPATALAEVRAGSTNTKKNQAAEQLQSVFTAVLKQAGQSGYASADPIPVDADLPDQITASWHQWFNEVSSARYSQPPGSGSPSVQRDKSPEEVRDDFQAILLDAYQSGAYATPASYLQSLSTAQLRTVQQIHHLAEPIVPQGLSTEASLNLLLPPATVIDADHNGLAEVGAARLLGFPNSDTPRDVRDAWEAATAELSEQDRMVFELQMMMPLMTANMKFDDHGQFVRNVEPGDPEWVNPLASSSFSYKQAAQGWLDYLDRFRYQMSETQYQSGQSFWSKFAAALA